MATLEVTAAACRGACTNGSHSTGFPLSRAPVPGARPRIPRAMSLSCCTKCCSMTPPLLPGLGSERFRCNIEFFLPTSCSRTKKLGKGRNLRWRRLEIRVWGSLRDRGWGVRSIECLAMGTGRWDQSEMMKLRTGPQKDLGNEGLGRHIHGC